MITREQLEKLQSEINEKQKLKAEMQIQFELEQKAAAENKTHERMLDDWETKLFSEIHKSYIERRELEMQRIQKLYDAELAAMVIGEPEPKRNSRIRWGAIIGDICGVILLVLFIAQAIR